MRLKVVKNSVEVIVHDRYADHDAADRVSLCAADDAGVGENPCDHHRDGPEHVIWSLDRIASTNQHPMSTGTQSDKSHGPRGIAEGHIREKWSQNNVEKIIMSMLHAVPERVCPDVREPAEKQQGRD